MARAIVIWAVLLPAAAPAATTEADSTQGFASVRQQYGVSGSGVRVGVIAGGIAGLHEAIILGELPTTTFRCASPEGTATRTEGCLAGEGLVATGDGITAQAFPEGANLAAVDEADGTAMLEVLHDLAPGAELWFASVERVSDIPAAVKYLAVNVDVVVLGVNAHGLFPDGQNTITRAVDGILMDPAVRARAFIQAAGDAAVGHYAGIYTDSGGGDEFGHYHLFAAGGGTVGPATPPDSTPSPWRPAAR